MDQDVRLSTWIADLDRVGKRRAERFGRLGLKTVSDLIRHLPMRYEQQWAQSAIEDLMVDGVGTARGTVVAVRYVRSPGRGRSGGRFEATLQDHSATLSLTWFNAGYLRKQLHAGMEISVQGKVAMYNEYPQMVNARWQTIEEDQPVPDQDDKLRPIYPATDGLPSYVIEQLISQVLERVGDQLSDPLPDELVKRHHMLSLPQAFQMAHVPASEDDAAAARRRLAYNELLLIQLGIAIKRQYNLTQLKAPALHWSQAIDEHIRGRFGFELTEAQNHVIKEIAADLQRTHPMNRLLQGDVGAGKTVVALYALLMAVADRKQAALMAPTELLAEQHSLSISRMLEGTNVRTALLTSTSPDGKEVREAIRAGDVDLVIGTHSLLTEKVQFKDLAVVVVDEQHRFGVLQRAILRDAGGCPHYLVMTATPIPRTLSLTVFGDLDVSTIDKLPPGRTPITTRVVGEDKSDEVYRYVAKRLKQGRQAYVVVPTIDEKGQERVSRLKSVNQHAKRLQDKYFGEFKVATMHGRMKRKTRASIMNRFREGEIDVLVATTVIEVGVDVPNSTLMVVEHAERFGLAQLHQLRGRIGRDTQGHKSVCVLIGEPKTPDSAHRLAAIAQTTDGFRIAEHDLEIRGMGDFFGTRQHGMPALRVANIVKDMDLLQLAKRDATALIESDPTLAGKEHQLLRKILIRQYGDALGLIDVG